MWESTFPKKCNGLRTSNTLEFIYKGNSSHILVIIKIFSSTRPRNGKSKLPKVTGKKFQFGTVDSTWLWEVSIRIQKYAVQCTRTH